MKRNLKISEPRSRQRRSLRDSGGQRPHPRPIGSEIFKFLFRVCELDIRSDVLTVMHSVKTDFGDGLVAFFAGVGNCGGFGDDV